MIPNIATAAAKVMVFVVVVFTIGPRSPFHKTQNGGGQLASPTPPSSVGT